MTREANFDQLIAINNLHEGDKVLLTNGQMAEFVRAKQKKFIGIIDGSRYDIPMAMFKEVTEKVDAKKRIEEKKKESVSVLKNLKNGDWFYINKNGMAIAFIFEALQGNKIIGVNPIDGGKTKIDSSFEIKIIK